MKQSKRCPLLFAVSLLMLFTSGGALAQAQADPVLQLEPSYEISLQVVIGTNEAAAGAPLPAGLNAISRQLKSNFSFSNYRLANTFLGRVSNTGNIEYKSISNLLGQETDQEAQTFLEWSMGHFRSMPGGFQARSFRFGARVPVRVGTTGEPGGRMTPIINYEPVGLTMHVIGLPANTPTLVGTISLPKATGTIFLVATVRSAEM